jgi:predicted DNA-binding transcriptional regulator AlpA
MRILTPREAWRRGGNMSKTTDWRLRQTDPTYPRRVQVSPGKTGYVEEEWEAWLAARPRVEPERHEPAAAPEPEAKPYQHVKRGRQESSVGSGP